MKKSNWVGATLVGMGGVLFVSGSALADPRTHDGFQFRGALGAGYLSDSEKVDGVAESSGKIHGAAAALELYFGGTPIPGLSFGGFVSALSAPGPDVELNGGQTISASNDYSLNLSTIGPYVDFYPDPHGGFHALATVGYARVSASRNGDDEESTASTGIGLGLGVGYDAWVGDEWTVGVLGRFTYANTGHDVSIYTVKDNAIAPAFLFSLGYH